MAVPGSVLFSFISNIKDEKSVILEGFEGNLKVSTTNIQQLLNVNHLKNFQIFQELKTEKPLF